jgi:hypothetical protein
MVALPRNAHSPRRGALRRAALSMAATGDGKKEKKEEEDTFEVTWEHEDGTIDTTTAVPIPPLSSRHSLWSAEQRRVGGGDGGS